MNWGYKILFVYLAFAAGIAFLAIKSMNEKMDLVTPNYYAEELKHQDKINQETNVSHLSSVVKIDEQDGKLLIHFPKDFDNKTIEGSVKLYCPSDENKDYTKNFQSKNNEWILSIPAVNKGLHEIHLTWKVDGVDYYFEHKMML
jgi:hypothetical protein